MILIRKRQDTAIRHRLLRKQSNMILPRKDHDQPLCGNLPPSVLAQTRFCHKKHHGKILLRNLVKT